MKLLDDKHFITGVLASIITLIIIYELVNTDIIHKGIKFWLSMYS